MNAEFFVALFLVSGILAVCGRIIYMTFKGYVPKRNQVTGYVEFPTPKRVPRRRTTAKPKKKSRRRRR